MASNDFGSKAAHLAFRVCHPFATMKEETRWRWKDAGMAVGSVFLAIVAGALTLSLVVAVFGAIAYGFAWLWFFIVSGGLIAAGTLMVLTIIGWVLLGVLGLAGGLAVIGLLI